MQRRSASQRIATTGCHPGGSIELAVLRGIRSTVAQSIAPSPGLHCNPVHQVHQQSERKR